MPRIFSHVVVTGELAATSGDELTRTAQSVEMAAAHLDNFLTLVRFTAAMDRASSD